MARRFQLNLRVGVKESLRMRMCGRLLVLIVMQLPTLVGYAGTADNLPPSGDRIINLPVKFLGFDGKELLPSMRPNHLSLDLYSIPGKLRGDTHQQFESVYLGGQTSIALKLDRVAEKIAPQIAPRDETAWPELEVTPTETRFARVVPGIWFRTTKNIQMKVMFYDADTKDVLTLVYFDRPCHVRGTDRSPTPKEIDVEAAGWTWIETKSTGPSTFVDVRAASPRPVLLIAPIAGYQKYLDGIK